MSAGKQTPAHGGKIRKKARKFRRQEHKKKWEDQQLQEQIESKMLEVTEFVTDNEVHGFAIKHLPSLCKSDYWHYHNKFTGSKRQAIMEIHDKVKGKISEFTYTA